MNDSKYRLKQYQTNGISGNPKIRHHAGDWVIQIRLESGWQDYDGPYAPHERQTAERRLREFQAHEIPDIFGN